MRTTVTGLFDDYSSARTAVTALESAGIDSEDISIVANKSVSEAVTSDEVTEDVATGAGVGTGVGAAAGLLAGLGVLAIPGVGPVVAAGWLAATVAGGAAGAAIGGAAGGLIGALTEKGVTESDAHFYAEGVRRGSTMVSVQVDESRVDTAQAILDTQGAVNRSEREAAYREGGWERFNAAAPPYSNAEIDRERSRYIGM